MCAKFCARAPRIAKRAQWVRTTNEIINSAGPAPPARHPQALDLKTQNMPNMKCCVVGDCAVGKTSLLTMYTANEWPDEVIEKSQYIYYKHKKVEGQPTNLELHDTPGDPSYGALRPLAYPGTDVFILIFSIASPSSLESVASRWWPEINHHLPEAPFILVGTQADLRDDQTTIDRLQERGEAPVTTLMGSATAEKLGARCYLECSALTQAGLEQVFETAVGCASSDRGARRAWQGGGWRALAYPRRRENGKCVVM